MGGSFHSFFVNVYQRVREPSKGKRSIGVGRRQCSMFFRRVRVLFFCTACGSHTNRARPRAGPEPGRPGRLGEPCAVMPRDATFGKPRWKLSLGVGCGTCTACGEIFHVSSYQEPVATQKLHCAEARRHPALIKPLEIVKHVIHILIIL